jgi:hypothetical protein
MPMGLADHPRGDGALMRHGESHSRRHRRVQVEPDNSEGCNKRGHVCARRHLTPDSLLPEDAAHGRPRDPRNRENPGRVAVCHGCPHPRFSRFPSAALRCGRLLFGRPGGAHAFIVAGGEITKQARNWIGNKLDASKRSQVMFMDRDDILNLFVVNNLPLPKGALPAPSSWGLDDDVPF